MENRAGETNNRRRNQVAPAPAGHFNNNQIRQPQPQPAVEPHYPPQEQAKEPVVQEAAKKSANSILSNKKSLRQDSRPMGKGDYQEVTKQASGSLSGNEKEMEEQIKQIYNPDQGRDDNMDKKPSLEAFKKKPSAASLKKKPSAASIKKKSSVVSMKRTPSMASMKKKTSVASVQRQPSQSSMKRNNPSRSISKTNSRLEVEKEINQMSKPQSRKQSIAMAKRMPSMKSSKEASKSRVYNPSVESVDEGYVYDAGAVAEADVDIYRFKGVPPSTLTTGNLKFLNKK